MTKKWYNKNKNIIEAWASGAKIVFRHLGTNYWTHTMYPTWNESSYEYKVDKKCEFDPGDKILFRDNEDQYWRQGFYQRKEKDLHIVHTITRSDHQIYAALKVKVDDIINSK